MEKSKIKIYLAVTLYNGLRVSVGIIEVVIVVNK